MYSIKSGGYCTQLRVIVSFFIVFLLSIYLNQSVWANTQPHPVAKDQSCTSTIGRIEVAKAPHAIPNIHSNLEWFRVKTLSDSLEKTWPDYYGHVWYKITWQYTCPTAEKNPITLFVDKISMAGEIYLNDAFLWSDQSIEEPISRSWFMPRYWILPAAALKTGENILTVRVVGTPTQKPELGSVALGSYQDVIQNYNKSKMEKRTLPSFNLMINLVICLFCFLIWASYPKEITFFWFGIVLTLWVSYLGLTLYPDPIFSLKSTTIDQIHIITFCLYSVTGCIAAWRFARKKYPRIERILWLFCAAVCIPLFFIPEHHLKTFLNVSFIVAVLIYLGKCISYPFIAYQTKSKEVYLLAFSYLLFIPVALNDAYYMMTLHGQILSPYTAPITSIFIGLLLALRFANNQKKIEKFNKTLKETIFQTEDELTKSLRSQYELSLENAKLQERMRLSHDLHDGIGGSIVRSLILVNKTEKVEKNQIMSILKLLRNDLRQVIDSGSSLGSRVPESPILWAAPIRHRFMNFFENFDVKSTWQFPNEWGFKPSPIQALTLARVTEEALNNIVKHSKATEVKISLSCADQSKLLLEIQDNGVGFDLDSVQAGFHVGLQSMKIRVERIGGTFEIETMPNNTIIRAIIYPS